MHFKFTSDKFIGFKPLQKNPQIFTVLTFGENHMTERYKLEPAIN